MMTLETLKAARKSDLDKCINRLSELFEQLDSADLTAQQYDRILCRAKELRNELSYVLSLEAA